MCLNSGKQICERCRPSIKKLSHTIVSLQINHCIQTCICLYACSAILPTKVHDTYLNIKYNCYMYKYISVNLLVYEYVSVKPVYCNKFTDREDVSDKQLLVHVPRFTEVMALSRSLPIPRPGDPSYNLNLQDFVRFSRAGRESIVKYTINQVILR